MSPPRTLGALTLLVVMAGSLPASAQTSRVVLDVPYLTEKGNLCGGAAVAMVFQYWGNRDLAASDFKSSAGATREGIANGGLIKAVTGRGWRASVLPAGEDSREQLAALANEVDLGHPAIALIERAPGKPHCVVVLAVTDRDVVIHDPASRPFETMPRQGFLKALEAAGSWAVVVLPPGEPLSKPHLRTVHTTIPADLPADAECAASIAQAVANSKNGAAERDLLAVTSRCPDSAAGWRELGGLRFVNSRWEEAKGLAEKAIAKSPEDQSSWKMLAASLYLQGNSLGALRAWNRTGTPRVETVLVSGANRTSHSVIVDRIGLNPGEVLTPSAFRRAARRAADLPVATDALVRFFPHDDQGASVEVDVREGPKLPLSPGALGNIGGRALILHEIKVPFAGLTGNGERIDLEYGWKRNRPRAAVRLTVPAPGPLPGLAVLELARSRQTFSAAGSFGSGTIVEDRRGVRLGLEDWATGRIHWNVDGMYSRLEQGPFVGFGGGLDTRWFDDHVALLLDGVAWSSTGTAPDFRTGSLTAKWRQRLTPADGGWSAETGATGGSRDTPLSFWSGADVSSSREAFLRGHKLLTTGIVTSEVFGRRLVFGSVSYERPVFRHEMGTVGLVGFIDTARAWKGMIDDRSAAHIDLGLGFRFHGSALGSIRLDFGYGLRDGKPNVDISAGFVRPWPRR